VFHPKSGIVTVFDDHCCQLTGGGTYVPATAYSRAIILKLDQATHRASLAHQYGTDFGLNVDYMGSTQPLANGNVFVGWGSSPYFSEYTGSGRLLLDAHLPGSDLSYRATVEPWVGLPDAPPSGAARATSGGTTVYATWNGATQVVSWRVLAGPAGGRLTVVAHAPKSGFETAIPVRGSEGSFKLQALDSRGRVLGTSAQFEVHN
jgi:hypothetical protein